MVFIRKFSFLAAAIACQVAFVTRSGAADVTVGIDSGLLSGETSGIVVVFRGIPYAAPPVGDLRWRNPRPAGKWKGVRNAREFGPSCVQAAPLPQSEDCLTLNIWMPAKHFKTPRPVMVWFEGDALVQADASHYPGHQLAAQGLVFVSFNYRMGRLGYFAHPALLDEASDEPVGNYGYMDQLAVLKWIRRNISAFGGDPEKVTIVGESAGGGSVIAHMASPLSLGLFRGAILESPVLPTTRAKNMPSSSLETAEGNALAYAASLGIDGSGPDALAALRALPATRLTEGASASEVWAGMSTGSPVVGISGPIVDGRFLPEAPEAAFAAGRQAPVPVIVGTNSREMYIGSVSAKDDLFQQLGGHAAEARRLYDPTGQETLGELQQQVLADKTLVEPSRHLAGEMVRAGQPTWWYRFSYVADALRGDPKWTGVPHGAETPYTLDIPNAPVKDRVRPADWALAALASAYWVEFATKLDPNGGSRPKWPRYDPTVDEIMEFADDGATTRADPLKPRLDLWQRHWEEDTLANHAGR
ncbi:para-nitrobenzyl esterase [Rhizobium mesoamericanum]|uniref:carboxylesterase/lipase family protein n=1 Tax=Rhizobium mesoamericanum TaxID=1079800 RepID=UPI002781AE93|nr:carboxylesterase family protein [Rhizobium mesoamericanum]MDQ0558645.1 para-nitrobenzyl esterase [Rhizobium mesoamericanum]